MQFIVPQFIDIESKIIGPITPRQFIILLVCAGFIFVAYKLADFGLFVIEAVIILGIGVAVAFVKVNQQPIYYFFLNIAHNFKRPGLRVWDKQAIPVIQEKIKEPEKVKEQVVVSRKPLSLSRLSQLALMVDTGGEYEIEEN